MNDTSGGNHNTSRGRDRRGGRTRSVATRSVRRWRPSRGRVPARPPCPTWPELDREFPRHETLAV